MMGCEESSRVFIHLLVELAHILSKEGRKKRKISKE